MSDLERHEEEPSSTSLASSNKNWMMTSFIPEVSSVQTEIDSTKSSLDGQLIRSFYESVVSSCETSVVVENVSKREERSTLRKAVNLKKKVSCQSDEISLPSVHRFLQFAQNGQVTNLRQCLDSGMDVNATDDYGWTALMCAASNGSKETVEFLLRRGANKKLVEKTGRSAVLLANRSGHSHIVRLLTEESKVVRDMRTVSVVARPSSSSHSKSETVDKFHCDVCRAAICGTTRSAHFSSTVHQFNERREERRNPPMTVYHIPESNVGFQLMLKDGWDRERGLGPDGNGMKFPPKTTLKRNRKGLGHGSKLKSRITHFGPGDVSAVERHDTKRTAANKLRPKTIERYERDQKEVRQKQMEIEFRRQFSALES